MNIKKISLFSVLALSLGQPAQAGKVQTTLSLATFIYENWQRVVPFAIGLGMLVKQEFSKLTGLDEETQTRQQNQTYKERVADLKETLKGANLKLVQVTAINKYLYNKHTEAQQALLSNRSITIPTEQELDSNLKKVAETAHVNKLAQEQGIHATVTLDFSQTKNAQVQESHQQNMLVRFFSFLFSGDNSSECSY